MSERPRTPSRVRAEHGVALLSALLTVALLTVIVIEMTDATMVHTHLSRNAGNAMAAQLLARSGETAGEALLGNKDANPQDATCKADPWAMPVPGIPLGSGTVFLQITDEGGKLDLNQVGSSNYATVAKTLFTNLGLQPELIDRIAVWIKPAGDQAMATGQARDYCALSMPCSPRQQPLNSLDELLLIRGFDAQTVALLRPHATAIPRTNQRGSGGTRAKVNVLTASPQVRAALGCEGSADVPPCPMSLGDPNGEKRKAWRSQYDEWQQTNCKGAGKDLIGIKSNVFSIEATGAVGDMEQSLRVLVQSNGTSTQRLSWQERPIADAPPTEVR